MSHESCGSKIMPPGLPHVAFVLLWYPLFTQPFIFREVECLADKLPLQVYTLYAKNLRHCSQEMKNSRVPIRAYGAKYAPLLFWSILCFLCTQPRKFLKLFRRSVCRKWNSWEIFGENLWAFCMGIVLGKRFREDGMDIVYAPWPRGAATAAMIGAEIAGLPFAIAARGDNLEPADPDLDDKFTAAIFVRANNRADKNRIENFGSGGAKGKTILLYNSLTLPATGSCAAERERFSAPPLKILALGRFDVTKGFDVLLDACAIIKKSGQPFVLTLAGSGGKIMGLGNMDELLRKQREKLGLENQVSMPGLISHDELPRLLAKNDIFAAPCVIHDSGRRDGIPNTVIEALSCGIPVVSTNINALPEVVINNKTGLTVPQKDPEALAKAILYLADHPDEARAMAENGIALAADIFDPDTNSRRFAEVFIKAHAAWQANCKKSGAEKCAA